MQSLRVVDKLEHRYPDYDGLNLTFETREGILKHCSRNNANKLVAADPTGIGARFLDGTQPSLEAQLCNVADEIAYNAHDMDDGVRSSVLTFDALCETSLFARTAAAVRRDHPQLDGRRLLFEVIRRILSQQIYDVIDATRAVLAQSRPADSDEVRRHPALVTFSAKARQETLELKQFLRENLYRHPRVVETTTQAKVVVRELFRAYVQSPAMLAPSVETTPSPTPRQIADYIAGMTDRFALREHQRLTGRDVFASLR